MTIPGLAPGFAPDAPPPPPPTGVIDPPLDQAGPDARIVVFPMSYLQSWGAGYNIPGGWDDATQINAALLKAGPGGHVHLVPGTYNTLSTIVVAGATPTAPGQRLSGERGTIIKPAFGGSVSNTGAAISCHGSEAGASRLQGYGAIIERLTIDGASVPAAAISTGLDYGDQYHGVIQDVTIQNFVSTGTTSSTGSNPLGAVGLSINNQFTLTEKLHVARVVINNCGTPNPTSSPNQGGGAAFQTVTTSGSSTSRMYSDIDITINSQPHQNGWVIARQGHLENGRIRIRGNFNCDANPANCAAIVVGVANVGGGAAQQGHTFNLDVDLFVESDGGSGGTTVPFTIAFGTNADNTLATLHGRMVWSYAGGWQTAANYTPSSASTAQFQFSGRLKGDTFLATAGTPTGGALISGTTYTNNGIDAVLYVSGGTVTSILVNTFTTGLLAGTFLWPTNATFQITASPMPTVNFVGNLSS